MPKSFITCGLLCLCLLWQAPLAGAAVPDRDEERAGQEGEDEQAVRISRREASEIVRQRYRGRILNIRLERGYWRLRLDNEGVVFTLLVDADTGEIRQPEE